MHKKSLRTYYIRVITALSIGLLLFLIAAHTYSTSIIEKRSAELAAQSQKAEAIDDLSVNISQLFFRARGFYAFKDEGELRQALAELHHIREANDRLRKMELTKEERQFTTEIDGFISNYEENIFPEAIAFVDNNDYEGLRTLSGGGTNLSVNQFIKYADRYGKQAEEERDQFNRQTAQQVNRLYFAILLVGGVATLFLIFLSWRVVRKLITPIESMTAASENYLTGQDVNYDPETRTDELGSLSRSFSSMMYTIQTKEQELVAQNEELLSQKDELLYQQKELVVRQSKLEVALSEARYAKIRLERYNGLSHQLSFSDDLNGIATKTLDYLNSLFVIETGIIYIPSSDLHVLQGISDEAYAAYSRERTSKAMERLKYENCFQEERILDDGSIAYDLYAATQVPGDTFKALFILSRSSREFTEEDQADLFALANRVAFAIDRIDQHAIINRERELNQTILDNLEEGIQFISTHNVSVQANRALSNLTGQPSEQLNQPDWIDRMAVLTSEPDTFRAFIRKSVSAESTELAEMIYSLETPSAKVVALYGTPVLYEEKRVGTLFVHRDITREFEVDKMKTELVSTVSHELRTPLTSILGFTELLIDKEMDSTRRNRYLDAIYKEAKRLTSLINDFLDVQRMESGNLEYTMQEVDVADIAQQTIQNFPVRDSHFIKLQVDTEHTSCLGDSDRLIQVFTNLLSNAIKFSPEGGDVLVAFTAQEGFLKVTVKDRGIGIPTDELQHMFEKFYRFDNTYKRKIGGTGLGLAICRKIIEKHGGEITVASEENVGTSVSFTLPLH